MGASLKLEQGMAKVMNLLEGALGMINNCAFGHFWVRELRRQKSHKITSLQNGLKIDTGWVLLG